VIIGVPYDGTSTFKVGSRFAPNAIREASMNVETYSLRASLDVDGLKMHDLGNLHVVDDVCENVKRLGLVVEELTRRGKTVAILGGEHTITLGVARALEGVTILSFDAHMDMRNEYAGRRLSHTTFARRLVEEAGSDKVVQVGVRAFCGEELDFAKRMGVRYITMKELRDLDVRGIVDKLKDALSPHERIHLSIDMDVLDPSQAPAVQCPEPEGMSITMLLDVLHKVLDRRVMSFDITEVSPQLDTGITCIVASKIAFEVLARLSKFLRT
jgi:agmatinase